MLLMIITWLKVKPYIMGTVFDEQLAFVSVPQSLIMDTHRKLGKENLQRQNYFMYQNTKCSIMLNGGKTTFVLNPEEGNRFSSLHTFSALYLKT